MTLEMDRDALEAFIARDFGQVAEDLSVDAADGAGVTVRLHVAERHLRPGGTVSGPSLFMLADVAVYLAILSRIGDVPLAVTTSAHMDFMRKPAARADVVAVARLPKLGRSLAVGQVELSNPDSPAVLAQGSFTYSIPPKRD